MSWNIMILPVVASAFLAVGGYNAVSTLKKQSLIKEFAKKNKLVFKNKETKILEKKLNKKLAIEGKGKMRSFIKVKDLVKDDEISVFRYIELLELGKEDSHEKPHRPRIGASFEVPLDIDLFFTAGKEGEFVSLYPEGKLLPADIYFQKIRPILEDYSRENNVTISFRRGRALLHINPKTKCGESIEDLQSLLDLSRKIKMAV
ncbi:hypothetical protein [uncultured Ilyobacter sp.]|uniref:hypothetical protein n=1 Tax=uncultured Ilyobacter sp. TaxID=544433 RepID=UPI0029C874F9|nr:hypothetical protein [uncultured Ilyobacter sp.]